MASTTTQPAATADFLSRQLFPFAVFFLSCLLPCQQTASQI